MQVSKQVKRFLVSVLNVQTQGATAQLTKHKRFQWSFELSKNDVRLPKLFRQTVPQCWPGGSKTAVTELVAWSLDQAHSIVSRLQRMAAYGGLW